MATVIWITMRMASNMVSTLINDLDENDTNLKSTSYSSYHEGVDAGDSNRINMMIMMMATLMMIIARIMMVTVKQWWWLQWWWYCCTVDTMVTIHPQRTFSPVIMIAMTMILDNDTGDKYDNADDADDCHHHHIIIIIIIVVMIMMMMMFSLPNSKERIEKVKVVLTVKSQRRLSQNCSKQKWMRYLQHYHHLLIVIISLSSSSSSSWFSLPSIPTA